MTDELREKLKVLADAYHTYRKTADQVKTEQREMLDQALTDIRHVQVSDAKTKIDSLLH